MSVQDNLKEMLSTDRLASTGYRYSVCIVVGGFVGMICFLLILFFFYIFGRIV